MNVAKTINQWAMPQLSRSSLHESATTVETPLVVHPCALDLEVADNPPSIIYPFTRCQHPPPMSSAPSFLFPLPSS